MPADQAAGSASILLLLLLALMAVFAGLGIMMGVGSHGKKTGEGGGMNVGKIVTFLVIGLVLAMWLSAPGTGQGLAAVINAMWANLVIGLQPLVAIVTQLGMVAVILVVGYFAARHFFRRR